jgi:hypothetical protein
VGRVRKEGMTAACRWEMSWKRLVIELETFECILDVIRDRMGQTY